MGEPGSEPASDGGGEERPPANADRTETEPGAEADRDRDADGGAGDDQEADRDRAALLAEVEAKYDFEDFGPRDMAQMTAEEWDVAFDPETWITGPELLDRVESDLRARIARRDVFAVVERETHPETGDRRLVAYSDEGYAVVYEDGSVEGEGTVLRDVKPSVALCSMDDYEVPDVDPEDGRLPDPGDVPEGSGDLGNKMIQAIGVVQLVAGLVLFGAWIAAGLSVIAVVVALGFIGFGVFLLVVVANARLSDRFRADEYRDRLRAAGVDGGERPSFVPSLDGEADDGAAVGGESDDGASARGGASETR